MNGVLSFAGFRKDAPLLAAGCFTGFRFFMLRSAFSSTPMHSVLAQMKEAMHIVHKRAVGRQRKAIHFKP